ncbi:MAG: NAD(P)/FAD-dependent oxidoreductase [Actinobacteria bacterium]|nr:NAD(P)/FAD-dependent oxidoreductase [Actinomycetota bacterium]
MNDALVIGAGHNGLAAAIVLADAGWDVTVLERNSVAGGAVRTEEVTLPGFRHDLFATNLNLFAGSPFFARYGAELADHGLSFVACDRPFSSAFPDGRFLGISTDRDATRASIAAFSADDADAWFELSEWFSRVAPHLFPLLATPLPSVRAVRALLKGTRALGRSWPGDLTRLVFQSPREFVEERFGTPEVQALCASWGMHLDFAPDVSGGALFPFLESMASFANGMVLGRGGAGNMIDAMVSLLEARGGTLRCDAEVDRILVEGGKTSGVVLTTGERLTCRRAVLANLTPTALFGRLLRDVDLPDRLRRQAAAYRYGPGTMMIHLAMDGPAPWRNDETADYAYVHIGPYVDDMALAYQRVQAGLLPETPTLVVGQPTVVDPSRAPAGKHVLWVQVRMVPGQIRRDALGEIDTTSWAEAKEPYADRVMSILESYAPGLGQRVLGRAVLSPADLEAADANLVGGDSLSGSHHLMQYLFLRPMAGWSRYKTPVERLWMCGASTWPGAGVGAGSGLLAGSGILAAHSRRSRLSSRIKV